VSRRTFSAEYKVEVASKVLDDGMSVAQAGDTFGVGSTAIRRWVRQLERERAGGVTKATKPTTEIYTLSLHDALPISRAATDTRA